jgi:hypothetical protein
VEAASELISNGRANGLASAVRRRRTDPPVQNQPEAITMGGVANFRISVKRNERKDVPFRPLKF